MRGVKAKRLRRKVYGDFASRAVEYVGQEQFTGGIARKTGARLAIGFRRVYQDTKKYV